MCKQFMINNLISNKNQDSIKNLSKNLNTQSESLSLEIINKNISKLKITILKVHKPESPISK